MIRPLIRRRRLPVALLAPLLVLTLVGCGHPATGARGRVHVVHVAISGRKAMTPVPALHFRLGDQVTIDVTSDSDHEIHVHGYDVEANVTRSQPATIRFAANIPGSFLAEIEDTHTTILNFDVR